VPLIRGHLCFLQAVNIWLYSLYIITLNQLVKLWKSRNILQPVARNFICWRNTSGRPPSLQVTKDRDALENSGACNLRPQTFPPCVRAICSLSAQPEHSTSCCGTGRHCRLTTRRLRKQRLLMLGKHGFKGTNGSHRAQYNDGAVLCGRHSRPTQSLPDCRDGRSVSYCQEPTNKLRADPVP